MSGGAVFRELAGGGLGGFVDQRSGPASGFVGPRNALVGRRRGLDHRPEVRSAPPLDAGAAGR